MITSQHLSRSLTYDQYRLLIDDLLLKGLTTGDKQTAEYLEYTRVNVQRMKRLDKTIVLSDAFRRVLDGLTKQYTWIVLTEAWCGDTAQTVPLLNKIAGYTQKVQLRLLLRDENPEVMDQYLTNGARSIPKLIAVDSNLKEMFVWGPRPAPLQSLVKEILAKGVSKEEKGIITQSWYNTDATNTTQQELSDLLKHAEQI
jgi:hypothetical protein